MERKPAYQFLKEFYAERGITEEMDLKSKEHALEGLILYTVLSGGQETCFMGTGAAAFEK
jgi:hypothetical protein